MRSRDTGAADRATSTGRCVGHVLGQAIGVRALRRRYPAVWQATEVDANREVGRIEGNIPVSGRVGGVGQRGTRNGRDRDGDSRDRIIVDGRKGVRNVGVILRDLAIMVEVVEDSTATIGRRCRGRSLSLIHI